MKPAEQRLEGRERRRPAPGRTLALGTKSVLGAFFALAVVCGLFFSFGYTLGKHSIPSTFQLGMAPPASDAQASPSNGLNALPPAASGVQPPNPAQLGAAEANQTPATLIPNPASNQASTAPPPAVPAPAGANAVPPAAATPPAATAPSGSGVYQVQVFAGIESDADSLAAALQSKGYPANVVAPVAGGADNLYRVQVGPYLTVDEADAMRARLTADGYQAVVKQ